MVLQPAHFLKGSPPGQVVLTLLLCIRDSTALTVGTRQLTAVYGGDGDFVATTSNAVTEDVSQVTISPAAKFALRIVSVKLLLPGRMACDRLGGVTCWGFIDKSAKYVIEPKFQDMDYYGHASSPLRSRNSTRQLDWPMSPPS